MQLHVSVTFASCGNVKIQVYVIPSRFRNGNVQKVVRFRCIRSNGNVSKRHETANGNTGYPSCFRIGFTCFCDVSVYGFLEFHPVRPPKLTIRENDLCKGSRKRIEWDVTT